MKNLVETIKHVMLEEGNDAQIKTISKDLDDESKKVFDLQSEIKKLDLTLEKFLTGKPMKDKERFDMRKILAKISSLENKLTRAIQDKRKTVNKLSILLK